MLLPLCNNLGPADERKILCSIFVTLQNFTQEVVCFEREQKVMGIPIGVATMLHELALFKLHNDSTL